MIEVRKNTYYDIYYNPENPKEVKQAERIRKAIEARGFTFEVNDDAGDGVRVCEQLIKTQRIKL